MATEFGIISDFKDDFDQKMALWTAAVTAISGQIAVGVGTAALVSLSGATTAGSGNVFNLGTARNNFALQVTGNAASGAFSVGLRISLDGINWSDLKPSLTANGYQSFTNTPAVWVTCNLFSISSGFVTAILCAY